MDRVYSVSEVVDMFGVNHEETVRRWIRDGRLPAKRGLGRGGSTMLLEDIVDFANKPPRAYLKSLISWLDAHGIEYEKIADNTTEREQIGNTLSRASNNSAMLLGLSTSPASLAGATAGLIAGTAISTMRKKTHVPFTVKLVAPPELPAEANSNNESTNSAEQMAIAKTADASVDEATSNIELKKADVQYDSLCEETDIKAKIVDEQIKLIKLKQELAQIQAQISVTEGQIEYYHLLLQNN